MADGNQTRKTRAAETREEEQRIPEWVPPTQRVKLSSTEDVTFRWVRTRLDGHDDHENLEARLQEGFELVKPDDPMVADQVARGVLHVVEGRIVQKGQVLCKMDARVAAQRKAHYTKQANLHQQGVSDRLKGIRDDREMPLIEKHDRHYSREG